MFSVPYQGLPSPASSPSFPTRSLDYGVNIVPENLAILMACVFLLQNLMDPIPYSTVCLFMFEKNCGASIYVFHPSY